MGNGIKEDKEEAAKYFKKAAINDNVDSMIKYAQMLYSGDGIKEYKYEAARFFQKTAVCGDISSII